MKHIILAAFIALVGVTHAPAADAQSVSLVEAKELLSDAKDNGWVGEQPDGYLGVVKNPGNADQIVKQINQARRSEYKRIAEANDIAVADVEALAGKRAIERTQSGHFVKVNGQWQKKR